ncbi:S8 family serine peptidase [Streptomyces sp. f51]|uniref:S8 family peptidase n=1 Tax=Streptomyces sp. f51 TaxID=1827742 RepID=UPI0030CD0A31
MRVAPDITAGVIDEPDKQTPSDVAGDLPGVVVDHTYLPVAMPKPVPVEPGVLSLRQPLTFSLNRDEASVLVRGEIADDELAVRLASLSMQRPDIIGVFSDAAVQTLPVRPGDPPDGSWEDVARQLLVEELGREGLTGTSVPVAVVDTGINAGHLSTARGDFAIDTAESWSPPSVPHLPGEFPVGHGTMCAFDALIAAPGATILDVSVLLSRRRERTVMEGYLSDAVAAYAHLRRLLTSLPVDRRTLVVTNSWGVFDPDTDFPPGHPGNYSDSLAHPFNLAVAGLEAAGADLVFAAGNCGREYPDGRCRFESRPIVGANSHPQVLSIGGVDVKGTRVGYSSQGPGRLDVEKPDVCSFTHFLGSEAFGSGTPDSGTSAACPVVAGVVAALRTRWLPERVSPKELRRIIKRTADDRNEAVFSNDYGYGLLNVRGVLETLRRRR